MVKRIAITAAVVMAVAACFQCAQRAQTRAAWMRFCLGLPDNVYPARRANRSANYRVRAISALIFRLRAAAAFRFLSLGFS
jgi:hypothetical protein